MTTLAEPLSLTAAPSATPSAMMRFLLPVWTLTVRELVRFCRQRSRVIGALGQPILFWILFGAGLHGSFKAPAWASQLGRELSYQEYFFPGVAVMIVMFTAIFSTISIIEDRKEGFLQAVLVAPISRLSLVLGKLCGGTALAVIQAGLFMALAPTVGLQLSLYTAVAVLAWLTLLSFTLTSLGFVLAWPSESTQGFHALMSVFLMPMWLLSGAFFPAESGWLKWIVAVNPLTYGVAGLRRLMYAGAIPPSGSLPPMWLCVVVTVAFGVVCLELSVALASRRSVRNAR